MQSFVKTQPPPSEKFTVERDVVYRKVDGEELKLDAYIPEGEGKFPAVVVIHGGAWRMGDKAAYAAECTALANNGYADAKDGDSRIQAAACMAGVFEFPPIDFPLFREFLGASPKDNSDVYKQASPLHHVSKDTAPVLLLHGDQDNLVPLIGSQRFADALIKAGVENQLVVLKGVGHINQ